MALAAGSFTAASLAWMRGQPTASSQALKALRREVKGSRSREAPESSAVGKRVVPRRGKEERGRVERGDGGQLEVAREEEQDGGGGERVGG